LFIEVAEQVERLDRYVGALDGTLQETPEVLQAVGVNMSVNVRLGVIDDAVDLSTLFHAVVGTERVSVEGGASFNVLADDLLKLVLLAVYDDLSADLAPLTVAREQAHHGNLADHRTRLRNTKTTTLGHVHVARLATEKGSSASISPFSFPPCSACNRFSRTRNQCFVRTSSP